MDPFNIPRLDIPVPKLLDIPNYLPPLSDGTLADGLYSCLEATIKEAEAELEADEQLSLYTYVGPEAIRVQEIGYHNPHLMRLYGIDNEGRDTTVMVHTNALQLVMKVVKITKPEERRSIGFVPPPAERE